VGRLLGYLRESGRGKSGRQRSLWSFVGFGGNALFVLIAALANGRALGVDNFGVYVGLIGFMGIPASLATFGTSQVLIARVSSNRGRFGELWGAMLATLVVVGGPMFGVTLVLATVVLPGKSLATLALFGLVEFLTYGLLAGNGDACIAAERYDALAMHFLASSGVKALAAVTMLVAGWDDLRTLALLQVGSMAVVAIASLAWLRRWDPLRVDRVTVSDTIREGSRFALAVAAVTAKSRTDVTMLVRSGFDTSAGLYGAGTRFISYGTLPAQSVLLASYAEFFKFGADGIRRATAHGRRLVPSALGLTVVGSLVAVAGAPVVAKALGSEFDRVVWVVLAMAGLPLLRSAGVLVGNILTGSGYQGFRSSAEVVGAVANVVLNILLIPHFEWAGAVLATYGAEVLLLVGLGLGIRHYARAEAGDEGLKRVKERPDIAD
jgi:O-antigen/teichoic acid export membrane protein